MNDLFKPFLRKFVLVFFDKVLVYSQTLEDCVERLKSILGILQDNRLFANHSKCRFAVAKIEYLGHLISTHGVQADPLKLDSMVNWPLP